MAHLFIISEIGSMPRSKAPNINKIKSSVDGHDIHKWPTTSDEIINF